MTDSAICKNCHYWNEVVTRTNRRIGYCTGYKWEPSEVYGIDNSNTFPLIFPTEFDDWCGKYEQSQ